VDFSQKPLSSTEAGILSVPSRLQGPRYRIAPQVMLVIRSIVLVRASKGVGCSVSISRKVIYMQITWYMDRA
jgi:hypothetical protein